MIIYVLVLHICTKTVFAGGFGADNFMMNCTWQERSSYFMRQSVCDAEGRKYVKDGGWGDDISGVTHVPDSYRCQEITVEK